MILRLKHTDLENENKIFGFIINNGLLVRIAAAANELGLQGKELQRIELSREPDKNGVIYVVNLIAETICLDK
jgi:hypothetical protein